MMKEFSENPAFVDMMDSMRKAFSFEGNMEGARAAGMEQSVRMNIVKERLRRKAEANAAAKAASTTSHVPVNTTAPALSDDQLIDEFASILTGGGKKQITVRRVAAAGVTVLAVLISVLDRIDAQNLSIFAVVFGCFAGAIVGVQRALNGQINESTHQSFATSWLNFIMGTTFLVIFLTIGVLINRAEVVALPAGPWWMYTGGTIGVIYIAFTSTIVQHLGVLTFTLISVGGQLVGSLLIDLYSPTQGVQVSAYLVTGILMTYLGVVVGGAGNLPKLKLVKHR